MYKENQIRSPQGILLGRIIDAGNRIEARKASGLLMGWYCKTTNSTRKADGYLFCWGNGVHLLL